MMYLSLKVKPSRDKEWKRLIANVFGRVKSSSKSIEMRSYLAEEDISRIE